MDADHDGVALKVPSRLYVLDCICIDIWLREKWILAGAHETDGRKIVLVNIPP